MSSSPNEKMDILKSCLASKGLKSTHQRDFIAAAFFKTNTHISLEELLSKVRKRNPRVGYVGDGQTRYENLPKGGHHDHIICIKCSKIEEFQNEKIEELQSEMAKKHGFKIINHKLELYGYCADCA
jgi:Fur family ferric uptake transcriptional regulator